MAHPPAPLGESPSCSRPAEALERTSGGKSSLGSGSRSGATPASHTCKGRQAGRQAAAWRGHRKLSGVLVATADACSTSHHCAAAGSEQADSGRASASTSAGGGGGTAVGGEGQSPHSAMSAAQSASRCLCMTLASKMGLGGDCAREAERGLRPPHWRRPHLQTRKQIFRGLLDSSQGANV